VAMLNLRDAKIRQIAVVCQDVARATEFYRDTLGLQFLFSAGPTLSFVQCGDVRLMLSTNEGSGDKRFSSMLYYFVKDIEGTQRDLKAKGVEFIEEPHMIARMPDHELWLSAFKDSEGNMIGLMEEKR
jgi:predicted enzyme related to lactoylglutathione lyase